MLNFIHDGKVLQATAPYNVSSGGGCKVGSIFGIAAGNYTAGQARCPLAVTGVFDLAKDGSAFTQGAHVFWDDTAKKATSTATGNMCIGAAEDPAQAGDKTVHVWLVPYFGTLTS